MTSGRPTRWCPRCGEFRLAHEHPPTLFDQAADLGGPGQARASDPQTSKDAARFIRARATSARVVLLEAHEAFPEGLTDEEAATRAGLSLSSEYATRCSELMRLGYLTPTGDTRRAGTGAQRRVLRITPAGAAALAERRSR